MVHCVVVELRSVASYFHNLNCRSHHADDQTKQLEREGRRVTLLFPHLLEASGNQEHRHDESYNRQYSHRVALKERIRDSQ